MPTYELRTDGEINARQLHEELLAALPGQYVDMGYTKWADGRPAHIVINLAREPLPHEKATIDAVVVQHVAVPEPDPVDDVLSLIEAEGGSRALKAAVEAVLRGPQAATKRAERNAPGGASHARPRGI